MNAVKRHPVMAAGSGLILAAIVALSLYLGVSITTANEGKNFIEFEGSYVGSRTIDGSTPGVLLVMTGPDAGDTTSLGSFTRTGFMVEDITAVPERCGENPGGTGIAGLATYAFADTGDILVAKRTGAEVCILVSEGRSDGLLDFEVIGGTGRFESAKGKIKERASGDLVTGEVSATLSGRVRISDDD